MMLAAVGLLGVSSSGQEASPLYEIRGVVVESGSGQPLEDVEVSVQPSGNPEKLATDLTGAFRFRVNEPGRYVLTARKPSYDPSGHAAKVYWQYHFDLSKEKPRADLHVSLARPCSLTGRIVDSESKKPVAGASVRVYGAGFLDGAVHISPLDPVNTTKADGVFRMSGLPPG